MNTQVINGIEYVKENITGKGECWIPVPVPIPEDLKKELKTLLIKHPQSMLFLEFGPQSSLGSHKDHAIQVWRGDCALFIWDAEADSYRLWTSYCVKPLSTFLDCVEGHLGFKQSIPLILEAYKKKFLK